MDDINHASLNRSIRSAEVCISCGDLAALLSFFTGELGFRVDQIFPADAPRTAVISGYGVTLRLEESIEAEPSNTSLRLHCDMASLGPEGLASRILIAPNGTRVELVDIAEPAVVPGEAVNLEWVLTRGDGGGWGTGRAGMQYRDLIPSRLGGRFIVSHIRIPDGGLVPDYVHFHKIRFQLIFCKAGWVRVVYQDQGPEFVLQAGDCVLQPPEIRHRVLEASAGLEVIEVGCPAVHETWADHSLGLPTNAVSTGLVYRGQRFVRHIAAHATWVPSDITGFEARDTGIAAATNGLAGVRVLRPVADQDKDAASPSSVKPTTAAKEFHMLFVLAGQFRLVSAQLGDHVLRDGDFCVLPGGVEFGMHADSGTEALEVTLPVNGQRM